jgi:hypothetical protein
MVDKVIALGLIDVRDIEEVGTGPLMEELGLDEEKAQQVVDLCAEEAKIVAVEQEAKKKAEAVEKAKLAAAFAGAGAASATGVLGGPLGSTSDVGSRGVDGVAFANPLLPRSASASGEEEAAATREEAAATMPGTLEATDGIAPEIGTHAEAAQEDGAESPEERAMQTPAGTQSDAGANADGDRKDFADEDSDTAALAEGRAEPPASTRPEP